jgi:hypothetical protein
MPLGGQTHVEKGNFNGRFRLIVSSSDSCFVHALSSIHAYSCLVTTLPTHQWYSASILIRIAGIGWCLPAQ